MSGEAKRSTPAFRDSPRNVRVIKAALMVLRDRVSFREQARTISDWTALHAQRLKLRPFNVHHDKWTNFAQLPGIPRVADILEFTWHWLFEEHPWAIERLEATMPYEHPDIPNPLVPTVLEFMSPGADVQLGKMKKLEGHFAAYRPSFVNQNEIMIMAMECCVAGDPSKFQIEMVYRKKGGKEETEHVDGHAIPYEDHIMFVGKLVEISAPFIFILSGLASDPKNRTERGHGTLLVGAPGVSSSAFPIAIRRVDEKINSRLLNIEEFREQIPDSDEIERSLSRGMMILPENY